MLGGRTWHHNIGLIQYCIKPILYHDYDKYWIKLLRFYTILVSKIILKISIIFQCIAYHWCLTLWIWSGSGSEWVSVNFELETFFKIQYPTSWKSLLGLNAILDVRWFRKGSFFLGRCLLDCCFKDAILVACSTLSWILLLYCLIQKVTYCSCTICMKLNIHLCKV